MVGIPAATRHFGAPLAWLYCYPAPPHPAFCCPYTWQAAPGHAKAYKKAVPPCPATRKTTLPRPNTWRSGRTPAGLPCPAALRCFRCGCTAGHLRNG